MTARLAAVCLAGLVSLAPVPAVAQGQAPGPPGPYVVDLHGAVSALPQDPLFFPAAPSGTFVPARGLAMHVGGHVYLFGLGPARVGLGASLLRSAGERQPVVPAGSSSSSSGSSGSAGSGSSQTVRPAVRTSVTTIAPQISLNFGSADGWSYLSAGLGQARVRTRVGAFTTGTGDEIRTTPETALDHPSQRSLNFGFGARWFVLDRVAFSFDVRFHKLSLGAGDLVTPRTTLTAVSAGVSLR